MQKGYIIKDYVPLDFIKAKIEHFDNEAILKNKLLKFSELVDTDSGEIIISYYKNGEIKRPRRTARYKQLTFQYFPPFRSEKKTFPSQLTISGSLHYFYNQGKHNYNDFDIKAFHEVLFKLYHLFGLTPRNLKITQLEWGVNIRLLLPVSVNQIVEHCIKFKWNLFEVKEDNIYGKYRQALLKDYYALKVYNKGLHFGLSYDIIRIERKQFSYLKYCKQLGIGQYLSDLIESDFKGFRETLIANWNEVLFFDPDIDTSHKKIIKYRDPLFWNGFNNRTTRINNFNELRKANLEKGGDYQTKIATLIDSKINQLNDPNFTFSYFTYNKKPLTSIIEIHYGIQSNAC
jgi:hypothetical protein